MDAVPLAHKNQHNALAHYGAAIFFNRDVVVKFRYAPGFFSRGSCECVKENRENSKCFYRFQLRNYPATNLRDSDNRSELHLNRLAVGGGSLKKLTLREAKH